MMAWCVFWLDPNAPAPQIGIATAATFSLVAFLLSLGQILPPVSYLTRADKFVFGCTALVFLALGEVVVTSRLAQRGRAGLARELDRRARWIYPILFAGVLAIAFRA